MPRRTKIERAKGVFEVDWPLFGELSRGLALRVARAYDPQVVVGIATAAAGTRGRGRCDSRSRVPLDHGQPPAWRRNDSGNALPSSAPWRRPKFAVNVLIVDETCDSGATIRLAVGAIVNAGATEVCERPWHSGRDRMCRISISSPRGERDRAANGSGSPDRWGVVGESVVSGSAQGKLTALSTDSPSGHRSLAASPASRSGNGTGPRPLTGTRSPSLTPARQ